MSKIKPILSRFSLLVLVGLMFFSNQSVLAQSLSQDDQNIINNAKRDILYYGPDYCGEVNSQQQDSGTDLANITPGNGTPTGLTYPNLKAEDMVQAIIKYITAKKPNNVFINSSEGGAKAKISALVASSKNANVNPFAIVAIMEKESSFGDPNDYNIRHGNNAFGRTATQSQPNFQGNKLWYKWNSIKESVDYTDPDNKVVSGGGDQVTYFRNVYGDSIDRNSIEDSIMKYAPPGENDTGQYIQDVKNSLSGMAKLAGSSTGSNTTDSTQESDFYQVEDTTADSNGCVCPSSTDGLTLGDVGGSASLPDSIPAYWRNLIQSAAPKHKDSDPRLVAAVLWAENRGWPDPNKNWAVSSAGAKGPFQFIDSSWKTMGYDGNGDGVKDPNDPEDAVHAAFIHFNGSAGKPLVEGFSGDADSYYNTALFKRDGQNLLSFGASYNGSGAPNNTKLVNFPRGQNSDYVKMVYWLIGSNFQKAWHPEKDAFVDPNDGASAAADTPGTSNGGCNSAQSGGSGVLVGDLAWPVPEKYVKSNFVWFTKPHHDHPSSDIPVPDKTPVYSITSGKVLYVAQTGYSGGYGTVVTIESNGALFRYQHGTPNTITVKVGDSVNAGQLIMKSGYTGLVVPAGPGGTHLHVSIETGGNGVLKRNTEHCPQDLFKAMKDGGNIPQFDKLATSGCVSGTIY